MAIGDHEVKDVSTVWTRTGLKWIALDGPMPWPKGIPTFPEVDQEVGGTRPEALEADLKRLEDALQNFLDGVREGRCGSHQAFGRFSQSQWLRWGYLHADHHLRQFGV